MAEIRTPPSNARASGAYCSLPASSPSDMGIIPSTVASVVIMMGRKRNRQASTSAVFSGLPSSRCLPTNSTIRMLFDTAIPVIIKSPINDMMFSDEPVISSVSTTPATPGGTASRITNGSENDANCAISTR